VKNEDGNNSYNNTDMANKTYKNAINSICTTSKKYMKTRRNGKRTIKNKNI
jgi:hypothetical protein